MGGGAGGKALTGLICGFEALDGTMGLVVVNVGDMVTSSGDAKGGLPDGLLAGLPFFIGDPCLGGKDGACSSSSLGETDLTVLMLALELRESLDDVRLILLNVLLTWTTLSKVNFEGLAGAG